MPTEVPVHTAADGKSDHMELWALVNAETNADVRRIALSLWIDMRERQEEAGFKPTAAVWIAGKRLQPTAAEVAEHKARPLMKRSEHGTSETPSTSDDSFQDSDKISHNSVGKTTPSPRHKVPSVRDLMSGDLDF